MGLGRVVRFFISRNFFGLFLAIAGFCLPFFVHFEGLSVAGHIALSIFIVAAILWVFESIPIFATSLLVIFLQALLLSSQGLFYNDTELPGELPGLIGDNTWSVPVSALENNILYVKTGTRTYQAIETEVIQNGDRAIVRTDELLPRQEIVSNARHKLIGYSPVPFTVFIGTFANPIIILFLAGFMLAAGAVKHNLDKNLTGYLLKPFGQKPAFIVLGLMFITASISGFMSNTATTAMMMTVAMPIAMQVSKNDKLRTFLILSIPVAANIGGLATPIGTPPNAIVLAALEGQGIDIGFGAWMALMTPVVIVLLLIAWLALRRFFPPTVKSFQLQMKSSFERSPKAILLYSIFGLTVFLWITEALHGIPNGIVALLPIVGLTVSSVLTTDDIRKLPWEVLWLVAGGIALGISMENTGLANWVVGGLNWAVFPKVFLLLCFGLVAYLLSIFLSNTVAATLLVPLAVSLAVTGGGGDGFSLALTALIIGAACSMSMVLPISTPPNAIAMSTGLVKTSDMAKAGLVIGLVGLLLALLFSLVIWPLML
ncbi:MAG TPA: DASS family sodium-coupled anion symporter [Bacteroidales bacterium]|nr:DASS family sodium-coupled anion symporter [Bacteroidales bacterium]